ncbi:hypothetical protein KSC_056860 [Ktedonobacter sp. SOSP1-52]|uniref:hypothetical protein n=1 Tax=Ktedonobacter sp. SOSP1-52 TaxID=2778366 RepID=UPI00191621DB|nr:hypothetical protein [Ktedonobacter sp. SOSP1-52]GHO66794.1 hypothetical protein KSC_056860 [Ktedonobacter sp. SOSP1-52]
MKQNRKGITSHLYGEVHKQATSRQHVGTSFGLHPEDTPKLIDETKHAGIDSILICADAAFHNGVKSGRCEFLALAFAKREIVAQDVENALQWAMYDTLRPALWRYGYVCGWNEEFYQYAMRKQQAQDTTPKPSHDERRER